MNAYMGSLMTLSQLTMNDLERSKSRSLKFRKRISHKELRYAIGYYLTLIIYGDTITFDLE